jgi:hypothetical protein
MSDCGIDFGAPATLRKWPSVNSGDDLAIWKKFPTAEFTLYSTVASTETGEEECRLGTFELRENI